MERGRSKNLRPMKTYLESTTLYNNFYRVGSTVPSLRFILILKINNKNNALT